MKDAPHTISGDRSSRRTTKIILVGSFIATCVLFVLLVLFNILHQSIWFGDNVWVAVVAVAYLSFGIVFLRNGWESVVNWMLIIFYELIAFCTLLMWGLNAPVGILTICFAIILPSILMRSHSIFPVVGVTVLILVTVQLIHQTEKVSPNLEVLAHPSTYWDVITYSLVLAIFGLVSWVSGHQREKNLKRTLQAESELQAQKDSLSSELEKESAALRLAQLTQVRELYKFALLGQSAAATLHELSSHLSVLNIDIDDLRQQHYNSEAITNAQESIEHINKTVRLARHQLNSYDQTEQFNALPVINQSIKDARAKFAQRQVPLIRTSHLSKRKILLTGSPMALMQIISVLLNNALDACYDTMNPKVVILLNETGKMLVVSVIDNGVGIGPSQAESLFKPIESTKPSGMGVGLYIAQHLAKEQFGGSIALVPTKYGAQFNISIPKEKPHATS